MSSMPYALRAPMGTALDEQQLRAVVPSLFAVQPHASRSSRFVQINSWDIIQRLMEEGFRVVQAAQGRVGDVSRRDYTKHSFRMRHVDDIEGRRTDRRVGDTYFEIVGQNASDGSKAWWFEGGLFRLVCLNGMTVSDGSFASVHVKHTGNRERIHGEVVDAVHRVANGASLALEAPRKWSTIDLSRDEQMVLAEGAHTLRFGRHVDDKIVVDTPIKPEQLLYPRRPADQGSDLWRTFNRIQENATKGGVTAMGMNARGQMRRSTTREVRGIDGDAKLNRALWQIAAKMAELKQAA